MGRTDMDRIRTDQIGYKTNEAEKAVFPNVEHCAFLVMNISTNDIVYEGTTGDKIFHEPSGEDRNDVFLVISLIFI